MGNRVVLQPNGKYAIFSTGVNDFTYTNCTREEVATALLNEELRNRLPAIERAIELADADQIHGPAPHMGPHHQLDGLNRWRDCLQTITRVHGDEKSKSWKEACLSG